MNDDVKELIAKCRLLEIDHDPDGWPAIRMRDISALCDEIERITTRFEIGETVRVITKNRERKGVITSKTENIYNTTKYQVYVRVPKRAFFLWFPESQVYKL